jgi:hypothetical protein
MHRDHQVFVDSLHARQKVLLTFYSSEDAAQLRRICAPMDFGPSRRARDGLDRYHFWDYSSDTKPHASGGVRNLGFEPQSVVSAARLGPLLVGLEMILTRLHVQNFRCHEDLVVDGLDRLAVLVGLCRVADPAGCRTRNRGTLKPGDPSSGRARGASGPPTRHRSGPERANRLRP